uniref:WAP domain-containing protein n=1 Tax=Strigamia maritima TaxID=126957 RepID=T1IKI9_STRMM
MSHILQTKRCIHQLNLFHTYFSIHSASRRIMLKYLLAVYVILYQVVQNYGITRCPQGVISSGKRGFCPYPIPEIQTTGIEAILCSSDRNCPGNLKCCPIIQRGSGKTYNICTVPTARFIFPSRPAAVEISTVTVTETVTIATILAAPSTDLWT